MDYKAILESFNIQTRLGRCQLMFEYDFVDSQKRSLYEEEFSVLANFGDTPMLQWIHTMRAKNRLNEENNILFDVLIELYKKLDKLEKIITQETQELIPLTHSAKLYFVGHEALCLDTNYAFKQNSEIYARMFLPIFPEHTIGIFAKVLHPQIAQIEHIHIKDKTYFDTFVANCERNMILNTKSLR